MLVVSTLPHFLAIQPIFHMFEYKTIIITSTTLSILYHTFDNSIITFLDYGVAGIWFLYDLKLGIQLKILSEILFLNSFIFFMNLSITDYVLMHSFWHLISACKCFYISSLIKRSHDDHEHPIPRSSRHSFHPLLDVPLLPLQSLSHFSLRLSTQDDTLHDQSMSIHP